MLHLRQKIERWIEVKSNEFVFNGIQRKHFFAVSWSNFISESQAFFIRKEQHFMLVEQLEVNEFFSSVFKKQKDPANNQTSTFTLVQGDKRVMPPLPYALESRVKQDLSLQYIRHVGCFSKTSWESEFCFRP